jgi:glutaminase
LLEDGVAVVYARIRDNTCVIERLRRSARSGDRGVLNFEDNDLAIEWCENRLIGEAACASTERRPLATSQLFVGMPTKLMALAEAVAQARVFAAGDQILTRGQAGDGRVFFIESGQVSILVPTEEGNHQRIASLGPGMNFGEMVLLGQTTRSATVYADTEVHCCVLEVQEFERISAEAPQFKAIVLENLARDLVDKLRRATQCIAALA